MLKDHVRTDAYRDFIYDNKHLIGDNLLGRWMLVKPFRRMTGHVFDALPPNILRGNANVSSDVV